MMPVLAQALLESITLLAGASRAFADKCVAGIQADEHHTRSMITGIRPAKIREELFSAVNKLKEFEAVDEIKSREQEELYDVLGAKLKLLSGYFENLEARVKYAFRKA